MKKIAAIILAAGKGKRMKALKQNKVVFKLADKHMIVHTVDLLDKLKIKTKIVVVGFAKKSVMDVLKDRVIYAVQKKRLGTAHAVMCGLKSIPEGIDVVLVLNGDDSAFYEEETIKQLIKKHIDNDEDVTFLTITVSNPSGLGRIVRDDKGSLLAIVEDKDSTVDQKKIREINPGCYVFSVSFLRNHMSQVTKNSVTGEYYINDFIDLAIKHGMKVDTVKGGKIAWRGVNTPEELKEAEMLFLQTK